MYLQTGITDSLNMSMNGQRANNPLTCDNCAFNSWHVDMHNKLVTHRIFYNGLASLEHDNLINSINNVNTSLNMLAYMYTSNSSS